MRKVYKLENLDCANCAAKMEANIKKIEGVISATVNFMTQRLVLEAEEEVLDEIMPKVEKAIHKISDECDIIL